MEKRKYRRLEEEEVADFETAVDIDDPYAIFDEEEKAQSSDEEQEEFKAPVEASKTQKLISLLGKRPAQNPVAELETQTSKVMKGLPIADYADSESDSN